MLYIKQKEVRMAMFLITLPRMHKEKTMSEWTRVIEASVGSNVKMDRAYIDPESGQAMCCWSAPDRANIEELFKKANVVPESIKEVIIYTG